MSLCGYCRQNCRNIAADLRYVWMGYNFIGYVPKDSQKKIQKNSFKITQMPHNLKKLCVNKKIR